MKRGKGTKAPVDAFAQQPMKDAASCEKLRGRKKKKKQSVNRRFRMGAPGWSSPVTRGSGRNRVK